VRWLKQNKKNEKTFCRAFFDLVIHSLAYIFLLFNVFFLRLLIEHKPKTQQEGLDFVAAEKGIKAEHPGVKIFSLQRRYFKTETFCNYVEYQQIINHI
jgi:hypothetical protein